MGWALTTKSGLTRTKKWRGFDNLRQRFVMSILFTWLSFAKFRKKGLHRYSVYSLFVSMDEEQIKDFIRPGATGEAFQGRALPNENCAPQARIVLQRK